MKIRNKRDRGVVIAPVGGWSGIEVEAGDVVDVPDDLGEALLEQSDRWEAAVEKPVKGVKE